MSIEGNEAHEFAELMRRLGRMGFDFDRSNVSAAIGCGSCDDESCWARLADLVDRPVVRGRDAE